MIVRVGRRSHVLQACEDHGTRLQLEASSCSSFNFSLAVEAPMRHTIQALVSWAALYFLALAATSDQVDGFSVRHV